MMQRDPTCSGLDDAVERRGIYCWGSFAIDLQEQAARDAESARWWRDVTPRGAGEAAVFSGRASTALQQSSRLKYETARWAAARCRAECCHVREGHR